MRSILIALVSILALSAESTAQRPRGRFNREGGQPTAPPSQPEPAREQTRPKSHFAIVGGDVYLGTGQRIAGATVLVGDQRIVAVGTDVSLPEGTKVLDAKGKTVCPGFVAVIGNGMGAGRGTPQIDSVNPFDPTIKQGLAAGITAFLTNPPGGGAVPAGESAVLKLAYGDVQGMVLKEGTVLGMSAVLGLGDMDKFTELVKKAKDHKQALADFTAKKASDPNLKPPTSPKECEQILKLLDGQARLWLQFGGGAANPFGGGRRGGGGSSSGMDLAAIRAGLEISRLLGTGVVLQQPTSAWLVPDEVAATGSMVILSPRDRTPPDPANPAVTGSNLASAAILAEAGVAVAVTCPGGRFGGAGLGTGGILGQDLNTPHIDAAFAVRGGLDNRKALRTLTLDAARILGVDDRIGSLEPGKDADILILDGDPLHYRTFVETAVVNGKVVYEKDKESLYSHIQR